MVYFFPEKDMLFVGYIKQQINKHLRIFHFKWVVLFAYENWAIKYMGYLVSLNIKKKIFIRESKLLLGLLNICHLLYGSVTFNPFSLQEKIERTLQRCTIFIHKQI